MFSGFWNCLGRPRSLHRCHCFSLVNALSSRVETLQKTVDDLPGMVDKRVTTVVEEPGVNLLKWVVGREKDRAPVSKVKVPNKKPFAGAHSAKELVNFLCEMETYFQAARLPEAEKGIPAKIEAYGRCEGLREGVQFINGRRHMSEEDKLFNFLSGLQTWAQMELRRQGVKDLPSTIVAADRLVDYRVTSGFDLKKKKKDSGKEKGKPGKVGKDGKFKKKKHKEVTGSGTKETTLTLTK
ncbi:UNVERIFIED_CONTAM: hypothetical protein Sradi_5284900 [Sesamum radiatum]|uniref:Uncharacterized protein n=1 Tax=Sesamum radiatum TaxID=300843 RepID=A0AAW2LM60_SESRA